MARKAKVAVEVAVPAIVEEVVEVVEMVEVVETTEPGVAVEETSLLASLMAPINTTEVVAEVAKPVVAKNQGVGKFIKELIADGLTNTVILAKVHEEYGNKNTTYACVAWYRNKMKKAQHVASQSKATAVVEKFLAEDEVKTVDLIDEEPEDESLLADELRQLVGQ